MAKSDKTVADKIGRALVDAAIRRRELARQVARADATYGLLLESRYGWSGQELDPELVLTVDNGVGKQEITLAWLDERMAAIGFKPNHL